MKRGWQNGASREGEISVREAFVALVGRMTPHDDSDMREAFSQYVADVAAKAVFNGQIDEFRHVVCTDDDPTDTLLKAIASKALTVWFYEKIKNEDGIQTEIRKRIDTELWSKGIHPFASVHTGLFHAPNGKRYPIFFDATEWKGWLGIDCNGAVNASKSHGRPSGTGFEALDARLINKMKDMLDSTEEASATAAAKKVIGADGKGAQGNGTLESKVSRLVRRYKQKYGE